MFCSSCKQDKELNEFTPSNKYTCKKCKQKHNKKYKEIYISKIIANPILREQYLEKKRLSNINSKRKKTINDKIWSQLKNKSKQFDIDFNLEVKDIIVPTRCPVFGIELKFDNTKPCDNSPSIDRIDNNKGYIKGNIIVVSNKANRMKNNSTIEEMKMLVEFYSNLCAS